jgi:hypothetical protein
MTASSVETSDSAGPFAGCSVKQDRAIDTIITSMRTSITGFIHTQVEELQSKHDLACVYSRPASQQAFLLLRNLKIITVLTEAHHLYVCRARRIQSPPSLRSTLILSSIFAEVFQVVCSLQVFRPRFRKDPRVSTVRSTRPSHPLDLIALMFGEGYKL